MDDLAVHDVVVRPFEVRQFEAPQLADRRVERLTARSRPAARHCRRSARNVRSTCARSNRCP